MDRKEYMREYRKKNKDKYKEYREKSNSKRTPEQIAKRRQYEKEYRENNKEKIKVAVAKCNHSDDGKKKRKIREWKLRGLIHNDYEGLYDIWLNTLNCELCNVELVPGVVGGCKSNTRCMDHCHETGRFRNIVCHSCNTTLK